MSNLFLSAVFIVVSPPDELPECARSAAHGYLARNVKSVVVAALLAEQQAFSAWWNFVSGWQYL
jgi:hypothetical protein